MTLVDKKRESPLLKRIEPENVPELRIKKTKKGENIFYFDQSSTDDGGNRDFHVMVIRLSFVRGFY